MRCASVRYAAHRFTITITGSSGLARDEVDRLVKDAEAHAADDQQRKDAIEARNQVDSLIYSVEKTLAENRDKPGVDAAAVEAALEQARIAIKGDDTAATRAAADALRAAAHAMAETLYRASQQAPGPDAGAGVKDGEVIDAEYAETV